MVTGCSECDHEIQSEREEARRWWGFRQKPRSNSASPTHLLHTIVLNPFDQEHPNLLAHPNTWLAWIHILVSPQEMHKTCDTASSLPWRVYPPKYALLETSSLNLPNRYNQFPIEILCWGQAVSRRVNPWQCQGTAWRISLESSSEITASQAPELIF